MPEPCNHVSTLYENSAYRVHLYHCGGKPVCSAEEEAVNCNEYVFPLSGLYVRRCSRSIDVADPTSVLFFGKDELYEIEHPIDGGDTSLIVEHVRDCGTSSIPEFEQQEPDYFSKNAPGSLRMNAMDWMNVVALSNLLSHPIGRDRLAIDEQLVTLHGSIRLRAATSGGSASNKNGQAEIVRKEIVQKAAVFMNRRYRDPISVDQISSSAGSSPFRLCRLFRERTGITLHNYVLRLRLRESLELLRHSRKTLTEIALEVGFSAHSHFGEAFRKSYGQKPSEYRQQFQSTILPSQLPSR